MQWPFMDPRLRFACRFGEFYTIIRLAVDLLTGARFPPPLNSS
jgi:hypothetical protein